jgi:hypothetical protein
MDRREFATGIFGLMASASLFTKVEESKVLKADDFVPNRPNGDYVGPCAREGIRSTTLERQCKERGGKLVEVYVVIDGKTNFGEAYIADALTGLPLPNTGGASIGRNQRVDPYWFIVCHNAMRWNSAFWTRNHWKDTLRKHFLKEQKLRRSTSDLWDGYLNSEEYLQSRIDTYSDAE